MSTDNLREQRLKHVTAFATRLARNQINETERTFAPVAEGDDLLRDMMWGAYMGHIAGRLASLIGRQRALAIIHELLNTYESSHDH